MKLRKINRKAQVNTLSGSILALGIAAIVLVLFLVILQETRDTDLVKQGYSFLTENETLTTVTETGETLDGNTYPGAECSVSIATNATGGEIIASGNFTTSNSGCTVSSATAEYNNTNWNITYTTTHGDESFTQANETVVGLGTFADFWTIIVLAIVAAVVIGIIFGAFGSAVRRR